jgi:hypothetical protein
MGAGGFCFLENMRQLMYDSVAYEKIRYYHYFPPLVRLVFQLEYFETGAR